MSIEETLRTIIREELAALKFHHVQAPADDRLLTAAQAAELLHVSERWLYKHAGKLPYAVRLSENVIRFSHNKIQAEIQRKLKMQGK
jgi:predicted DNA-binding transcriptional regulator AlpA